MGVKGLTTYVETLKIWKRHSYRKSQKTSRPRVILVDGNGCLRRLYHGDWMRGGQWLELRNECKDFVHKFRASGVEPIFFFDGSVPHAKRAEWFKRRQARHDNM